MNTTQLRDIISGVLKNMDNMKFGEPVGFIQTSPRFTSTEAIDLLIKTCEKESNMGEFVVQLKADNPALGFFQCEEATYQDIAFRYLYKDMKFRDNLSKYLSGFDFTNLKTDIKMMVVFARLKYWMMPEIIPTDETNYLDNLEAYWKKYYNTKY